jgi:hypothetical protein
VTIQWQDSSRDSYASYPEYSRANDPTLEPFSPEAGPSRARSSQYEARRKKLLDKNTLVVHADAQGEWNTV